MVTPFVHNDMWLKEGPAEYSGHLIEEWIGGQEGLLQAVKDNHFRVLREAHIDDDGFQALSPMPDAHIYGTHTYYKGASVMHNLRGYLGDELFRQGMRGVQVSLAERTMTPQQFRDSLEAATGADLDAFFDAWVFAPGYSVFVVRDRTSTPVGDAFEVTIDVDQKLRATEVFHQQVPLQVSFISAEGEEFLADMVASGANGQYTFTVPFDPALVDPEPLQPLEPGTDRPRTGAGAGRFVRQHPALCGPDRVPDQPGGQHPAAHGAHLGRCRG